MTPEEVEKYDKLIDEWHLSGSTMSAREYLGLTRAEYEEFVTCPSHGDTYYKYKSHCGIVVLIRLLRENHINEEYKKRGAILGRTVESNSGIFPTNQDRQWFIVDDKLVVDDGFLIKHHEKL